MHGLELFGFILLCAIGIAAFVYLLARIASVAHYRTKLEYWRTMIKEGDSEHGKE